MDTKTQHGYLVLADISGFTAMSEKSDPEDVTAVMNQCFEMLEVVVREHGGYVDKYIGDCIMALWGAPLDDPHHARRAVACALDMADTLQAFKRELGAADASFDVGRRQRHHEVARRAAPRLRRARDQRRVVDAGLAQGTERAVDRADGAERHRHPHHVHVEREAPARVAHAGVAPAPGMPPAVLVPAEADEIRGDRRARVRRRLLRDVR